MLSDAVSVVISTAAGAATAGGDDRVVVLQRWE